MTQNEILLLLAAGKITPAEAGELLTKVNGPTVSSTKHWILGPAVCDSIAETGGQREQPVSSSYFPTLTPTGRMIREGFADE